jgi:hypothetical protein
MTSEHEAQLNGDGALAQGDGAIAAGKQTVVIQGSGNTATITYQGTEIAIPALDAVAAHRVALRAHLERRACQRWGSMATYIHEEGAALPLEASPYQTGRLGPREQLLLALREAQRLLILGGPGAGKSVSLERLAWDLCDEQAQAYLVAHLADKGSDLYARLDDRLRERDGRPDLGVVQ